MLEWRSLLWLPALALGLYARAATVPYRTSQIVAIIVGVYMVVVGIVRIVVFYARATESRQDDRPAFPVILHDPKVIEHDPDGRENGSEVRS